MLYIPANPSCSPFFISDVETSELDLWAGKWGFAKLFEIGTSQFPDDSSLHVVKHLWWARDWARYFRHVLSMKLSSEVSTVTNDNDISPLFTNEKSQDQKRRITCPGSTLEHSGLPARSVRLIHLGYRWLYPAPSHFPVVLPSPSSSFFPFTPVSAKQLAAGTVVPFSPNTKHFTIF